MVTGGNSGGGDGEEETCCFLGKPGLDSPLNPPTEPSSGKGSDQTVECFSQIPSSDNMCPGKDSSLGRDSGCLDPTNNSSAEASSDQSQGDNKFVIRGVNSLCVPMQSQLDVGGDKRNRWKAWTVPGLQFCVVWLSPLIFAVVKFSWGSGRLAHIYSPLHRRIILSSNFHAWLNNNNFVTSELCIFPESVLRYSLSFFHCCILSESSFNKFVTYFELLSVYFLGHFHERELMLFFLFLIVSVVFS